MALNNIHYKKFTFPRFYMKIKMNVGFLTYFWLYKKCQQSLELF